MKLIAKSKVTGDIDNDMDAVSCHRVIRSVIAPTVCRL